MLRKTIVLTVVAAGLATAGCGGGGGDGGGNKLSSADQVKVVQARADVRELCGLGKLKSSTVQSRALVDAATTAMIGSVPELIAVYRKNPQKLYVDEAKKTITMRQLLLQQAGILRKCDAFDSAKFASLLQRAAR